MITELRKKFIAIAMLSLLGTMAALCIAIAISNHLITTNRADKVIQLLYLNDGVFPAPDEDIRPSMHGGFQVTTETPFETRYFIAHIDKTGKVDSVELDHIAAFDEDTVVTTIEKILKQDKTAGYADYYRFGSFKTSDGSYTLVVLDCFVQLQSAYSIIRVIAGIFVLCAGIVFALLLVLSERVIRPFVRNWESQRRFITDASHELKTPLAILSADLGLVDETDDNRPWLEGAREQIARMDTLIRSLVELARSEEALPASAVTAVCVSDAAASAAESFTPLAQASGKELETDIEQNLNISGVKDDIARLISLLLDNAVKYCDDGGTIELLALKRGKNIVIEISNPCADLDASQISHYFDRFYRADSSRARTTGGSGIGLSTAKAIVTRHRGRISDRYENGVITFAVSIPALHDQAAL